LVDPISDLILSHGRHIWPEGRETLGEVFHQAHKAAQFVLGYGLLWSSSAEMGNALIAKVCQAPVKAPINGIINAAKLIDRVSNVVRYVLVKRIIAHALNQCVDHIRTFHAAVNALISDRSVISVEQCMDPNNRHVLAGYAIVVANLADFLFDVWPINYRLPRALQEAERDHGEIRHGCEPGRAAQHMGDSLISLPNGSVLTHRCNYLLDPTFQPERFLPPAFGRRGDKTVSGYHEGVPFQRPSWALLAALQGIPAKSTRTLAFAAWFL
jgi:hypothetical protein